MRYFFESGFTHPEQDNMGSGAFFKTISQVTAVGFLDFLNVKHLLAKLKTNPATLNRISFLLALNFVMYSIIFAVLHVKVIPWLADFSAIPEDILEDERTLSLRAAHSIRRLIAFGIVATLKSVSLLPVYQISSRVAYSFRKSIRSDTVLPPAMPVVDGIIYSITEASIRFVVTFTLVVAAIAVGWTPLIGPVLYVGIIAWRMSFFFFSEEWKLTSNSSTLAYKTRALESNWAYYLGFGLVPSLLVFALPTDLGDFIFGVLHPLFCIMAVAAPREYNYFPISGRENIPRLPLFAAGNAAEAAITTVLPLRARKIWETSEKKNV